MIVPSLGVKKEQQPMKRYKPTLLLVGTFSSLCLCLALSSIARDPVLLELAKACGLLTAIGLLASINAAWDTLSEESRSKKLTQNKLSRSRL